MRLMVNKSIPCLAVFILAIVSTFATWSDSYGAPKRIELTDGTVIYGELVSVRKGCWTVNSDTLGIIKLDPAKIKQISSSEDTKETESQETPDSTRDQVSKITNEIQADSELMRAIGSLRDDPEVKKVLEDPVLMKAIRANDISYLLSNPKFLALLQDPRIREICQKVMENNQAH